MTARQPASRADAPETGLPLEAAFREGRTLRLQPGVVLFNEGDASSRVMLLLSGRVKVSTFSADGRETVLGYRGAGDVLGELSAIDGQPHVATVTVVDPVEALAVSAERFVATLESEADVAVALLRLLVDRLRDADRTRADYTVLDVLGRTARRLVELADRYGLESGTGLLIELPISQRELAGWVGSSREAVNKALAQLVDRNLIRADRRHFTVLDLDGLRRLSA